MKVYNTETLVATIDDQSLELTSATPEFQSYFEAAKQKPLEVMAPPPEGTPQEEGVIVDGQQQVAVDSPALVEEMLLRDGYFVREDDEE
jgi:hypothetical protein